MAIKPIMKDEISDKIVIATTTLYRSSLENDLVRAEIAKETITNAKELGYKIIVVDGGSSAELLRDFERLGAEVCQQELSGMGNCRRQAFKLAYDSGKEIIVWTEPEKAPFIHQIDKAVKPIIDGSADLVIPKRKSLESYPVVQQYAELLCNTFLRELTGRDLDYCFGPRIWKREFSSYFTEYKGEYGDKWEVTLIPIIDAISAGERVASVEIDYVHPRQQTESEEKDLGMFRKRIEQIENSTNACETHWRKLHQPK